MWANKKTLTFVIISKDTTMKHYLPLYALLAFMPLASCSDDEPTVSPLPEKTYTGNESLELRYNQSPMSGKSVAFIQNEEKATLTMGSTVSPGDLSESLKGMPDIPGPGVLPGTPVLSLPVNLKPDGGVYSFSGNGETEYLTYTYEGNVNASKMAFSFNDVTLKNQRLANTVWFPAPAEKNADGTGYKSLPLHIVWECSLPPLLEGFDGTLQDAMTLLVTLPMIPAYGNTAYMSIAQVIENALKTVAFRPDGNAVITYMQSNNGAAQFAQAPLCMIQYVPLDDIMMNLYINPTDLMGQILINGSSHPDLPPNPFGKQSRADYTAPLAAAIQKLAPMLLQGFPLQYSLTPTELQIFFNTETLVPLLKDIVIPMLEDPEIQQMIMEKIAANPSLASHSVLLKALMQVFPRILETTTRMELGFNLAAYPDAG